MTVRLPNKAFAFYDVNAKAWHTEKGSYNIEVGGSSRALPLQQKVAVEDIIFR